MKKLDGFSAAVIGCGGLGCNVAVHLCGMGIGSLVLCDFDSIEVSNLNRQFLYTPEDCGKPKAETAAFRLRLFNPGVEISAVTDRIIRKEDLNFASDCDIIISAVDNNAARETVSEFCTENGIPMINGGINTFSGNAYCYVPGVSPCPGCAGLTGTPEAKGESISSTAGIIGALEAELAVKVLTGDLSCSGTLFVYDSCELNRLKIKQSADCKICRNL